MFSAEDRKNLLNSEKTTQLEMDVLAKRQDLERQHNQILIKKQHQEKLMEKRKEQMEEKVRESLNTLKGKSVYSLAVQIFCAMLL